MSANRLRSPFIAADRTGAALARLAVSAMVLSITVIGFVASSDTALLASRWARFLCA